MFFCYKPNKFGTDLSNYRVSYLTWYPPRQHAATEANEQWKIY